jgi:hypothetical protein
MIHKILLLIILPVFSFILSTSSYAEEVLVFGPETLVKSKWGPVHEKRFFSVNTPCARSTLYVINGDGTNNRNKRIGRAVIQLNGTTVISPGQVNRGVDEINVPVDLETDNILKISLGGRSDSQMTVSIGCIPLIIEPGTFTAFGPRDYIRGHGRPDAVTDTFPFPAAGISCSLDIYNGGLQNSHHKRVSSAVIDFNGVRVAGPHDFNQHVSFIQKPVTLDTVNDLSVEVRGKPGGRLTVEIVCPELVSVPVLFRMSEQEAVALIQGANLTVGTISDEPRVTVKTGTVIGQNPVPGTIVAEGSVIDFVVVAPPPAAPDEIIPDTWAGEWKITTTYLDRYTNYIDSVIEARDAVCPADPFGFELYEQMAAADPYFTSASCMRNVADDHIDATCSIQVSLLICDLDIQVQFAMDLVDDTITGSGFWTLSHLCSIPLPSNGQTFTISGTRFSTDTGSMCSEPASSFLQKFIRDPIYANFLRDLL